MIRVGIVGARGFTGQELIRILVKHPDVRLTYLAATLDEPQNIGDIFPSFRKALSLKCEPFSVEKASAKCDLLFLALPHTVSMQYVPKFMKREKKLIDLSGDYRLKNPAVYERWYKKAHKDTGNLKNFVYGLPELYRERIRKASYVSNPGCYPTAAILGIVPALVTDMACGEGIIIDAKSGVSGAGKKVSEEYLYLTINENFKGYKLNAHQHSPEINQELSKACSRRIEAVFCPHLLPVNRGILETIYIPLKKAVSQEKLRQVYAKFYKSEPFVRVRALDELPELTDVTGTNFCDIGLVVDEKKKLLIVVSAIDNLIKGAAGQAVQNMNLMCGFEEQAALA